MPIHVHYIQLYRLCCARPPPRRNVRPTSQRPAVSPAALVSAADDDDFLDFSHDDMFLINGGPDLPRERTGSISSVDRRRSSLHITSALLDLSWQHVSTIDMPRRNTLSPDSRVSDKVPDGSTFFVFENTRISCQHSNATPTPKTGSISSARISIELWQTEEKRWETCWSCMEHGFSENLQCILAWKCQTISVLLLLSACIHLVTREETVILEENAV